MMKTTIFILTLFAISHSFAQIPGKRIDGPVAISDSITINVGDTIKFGTGSDPRTGNFVFIYQPPNGWVGSPEYKLDHAFAGTTVTVKGLKEAKSRKVGKKIFGMINVGGFNQAIDFEPAIEAGEIVAINEKPVGKKSEATQAVIVTQPLSVADELTKLKKLLDDGVLTQEEYDAQKKKLLDKN